MSKQIPIFKADSGHIFDMTTKSAAQIFNESILPSVERFAEEPEPEASPSEEIEFDAFAEPSEDDFISQLPQSKATRSPVVEENYDNPI